MAVTRTRRARPWWRRLLHSRAFGLACVALIALTLWSAVVTGFAAIWR